jgi:ferric-dicitrate binding protein FerR (iron transport regulator)
MSDRDRTPDEIRALDAVRGMERPVAPASVRAKALQAFLEGDAGEAPAPDVPPAPRPVERSNAWRWLPVAAVLALALFGGWWGTRPAETWRVADVAGPAGVTLASGAVAVGAPVAPGAIATGDSSEFGLQLGDVLRIRFAGGTRAELPAPPGRWFGKERTIELADGEVFGTTAGNPLGFTLRVVTPEAEVALTGTTFAVFRTPEATCFCLWNGSVDIRTAAGDPVTLAPGQRVFVYADGRDSEPEPLPDWEVMKLSMMDDAGLLERLSEGH